MVNVLVAVEIVQIVQSTKEGKIHLLHSVIRLFLNLKTHWSKSNAF